MILWNQFVRQLPDHDQGDMLQDRLADSSPVIWQALEFCCVGPALRRELQFLEISLVATSHCREARMGEPCACVF